MRSRPDRSSFSSLLLAFLSLAFLLSALILPPPVALVAWAGNRSAQQQQPEASTRRSPAKPVKPMSESQKAEHVLNRLGYGPSPGEIERVRKLGVQRYIEQQLNPEKIDDSALEARLEPLRTLRLSSRELFRNYPRPGQVFRLAQAIREGRRVPPRLRQLYDRVLKDLPMMDKGADRRSMMQQMSPEQRRFFREHSPRRIVLELQQAKLLRAVYSQRQLLEQMVDFWMNHFNVHMGKGMGRWLVTSYERDAIRPHALGKFRDLVQATARHPAMLFYLDNFQSAAPNSPGGRGLNENYARELMELHTLGVDGGYTQQDVVEVARCFTGWTFRPRRGAEFFFRPRMHDWGEKTVLGVRLRRGGGERDGTRVIDLLVKHPSTARFIATKLVRRFVADEPPEALVRRTAKTFRQSDGDIRQTLRTIFSSPEFLSGEAYRAKVKKPLELVASALRASRAEVGLSPMLSRVVARLGEPLYLCEPPTGYPDVAEGWINAGLMLNRVNFASALAANRMPHVRVRAGAVRLPNLSQQTRTALQAETEPAQIAALLLGSPEFQRR